MLIEIYFDGLEGCDFGFGECQVFGSPKFLVLRGGMLRALGLGQKKTPASLFRRGIETAMYRKLAIFMRWKVHLTPARG